MVGSEGKIYCVDVFDLQVEELADFPYTSHVVQEEFQTVSAQAGNQKIFVDLSKNTLNQFTYEANDLWKLKLGNDDYLEMDKNVRRGKETVLRPAADASFKTSKPAFDEQFLAVVDDSGLF